jgi:predicted MPP superfamily phosphohydrolase
LIIEDLCSSAWADSLWATSKDEGASAPLIIAVSGDMTAGAHPDEFDRAYEFVDQLTSATLLDTSVSRDDLFLVPGNHDVIFDKQTAEQRFLGYCTFYNKFRNRLSATVQPHEASSLTQIHVVKKSKVIVAEINSCLYVEKDTVDESRGQVDAAAIAKLRKELGKIKGAARNFIKIAVLHHHPVLIPSLVEPGRAYDAVLNGGSLMRLLRDNGFQLVLHGHKHSPQVFSYDPESAWGPEDTIPQMIVAGGSCGSRSLPSGKESCNSYNVITVKWDPEARHSRIQVITRGLCRMGSEGDLDPDQWSWKTLRVFNRALGPYDTIPSPTSCTRLARPRPHDTDQVQRWKYYEALRFNMPVAEIQPSLMPGQAYEVRVWLEPHKKNHEEFPVCVTWSAGTLFSRKKCDQSTSPNFCAFFHYWGPMLVQADMEFADGHRAQGYVYARFPETKG